MDVTLVEVKAGQVLREIRAEEAKLLTIRPDSVLMCKCGVKSRPVVWIGLGCLERKAAARLLTGLALWLLRPDMSGATRSLVVTWSVVGRGF